MSSCLNPAVPPRAQMIQPRRPAPLRKLPAASPGKKNNAGR